MYPATSHDAHDGSVGRHVRALFQRLSERLTAAANAAVERKDPKTNELSRDYFRFPPF